MTYSVQRLLKEDVYNFGVDPKDVGKWGVVCFVRVISVYDTIGEADEKADELNKKPDTAEILRRRRDDEDCRNDLREEYPEPRIRRSNQKHFERG